MAVSTVYETASGDKVATYDQPQSTKEQQQRAVALKSFVAGGIAGCIAKTSVAPLERTKILMQVSRAYGLDSFPNVFRGLAYIWKTEGFFGLYKGNAALLARIFPYAAIQFASFEFYNRNLSVFTQTRENPLIVRFFAGALAGASAVVCTYPLDLIRARFACQVFENRYDNLRHAIKTIFLKEGGLRGFYNGIYPTMAGVVPYAGINFFTYGFLRRLADRAGFTKENPTMVSLFCGACAGLVGQTFTFPLDVIRRRMQTIAMFQYSMSPEKAAAYLPKHGVGRIIPTLVHIIRHEGFLGMYKGLSVNYLKAAPAIAISFTTYDTLRRWWNIPAGKYSATVINTEAQSLSHPSLSRANNSTTESLNEVLRSQGLTTLLEAVNQTGLANLFEGVNDNVTVFAPTNEAFQNLNNVSTIFSNTGTLETLILYHVYPGAQTTDKMVSEFGKQELGTLESVNNLQLLVFVRPNGTILLGTDEASIVTPNLTAGNSVVQVISKVLIPPVTNFLQGPTAVPTAAASPNAVISSPSSVSSVSQPSFDSAV
eukprot:jgi/Galph1/687/GphlegSOOS_G5432.1